VRQDFGRGSIERNDSAGEILPPNEFGVSTGGNQFKTDFAGGIKS
jgi:hypothetical protein